MRIFIRGGRNWQKTSGLAADPEGSARGRRKKRVGPAAASGSPAAGGSGIAPAAGRRLQADREDNASGRPKKIGGVPPGGASLTGGADGRQKKIRSACGGGAGLAAGGVRWYLVYYRIFNPSTMPGESNPVGAASRIGSGGGHFFYCGGDRFHFLFLSRCVACVLPSPHVPSRADSLARRGVHLLQADRRPVTFIAGLRTIRGDDP